MAAPRVTGILLMLAGITIALIYLVGLVIAPDAVVAGVRLSDLLIRYTILIIMLIISGILAYIGFLIYTSPTPRPIEEIVREYKEYTRS